MTQSHGPLILVGTSPLMKNEDAMSILSGYDFHPFKEFVEGVSCPSGREGDVVAVALGADPFDADMMDNFPSLKTIARWGTGYDNVDMTAAKDRGIIVTRTAQANTKAVAEIVIANIINLSRYIVACHRDFSEGKWEQRSTGTMLSDLAVGFVGMGGIGRAVAERLYALGVGKLIYWNRTARKEVIDVTARYQMAPSHIDYVMSVSDVVIVALASAPETNLLINRERLSQMKPTAFLINVGRGSTVDEEALVDLIEEECIAGAALDVFSKEPPMDQSFFPRLQSLVESGANIILTPHLGARGSESKRTAPIAVAKNIVGVLSGDLQGVEVVD